MSRGASMNLWQLKPSSLWGWWWVGHRDQERQDFAILEPELRWSSFTRFAFYSERSETAQVKWVAQGQLLSGRCRSKTHNSRRFFLGLGVKRLWVDDPASWCLGEGLGVNLSFLIHSFSKRLCSDHHESHIVRKGAVSIKKNIFSPRNSPSHTYISLTRPWTWRKTWNTGLINGDTELCWEHYRKA